MAMAKETKVRREPLLHITKRDTMPFWRAFGIRVIAVLAALVVAGILTVLLTGLNPIEVYRSLFDGTFATEDNLFVCLRDTALLLCIALAVTPAFKMRFWNIGAEGQVLAGALGCAAIMLEFGDSGIPEPLLILIMLVTSILAGALWGVIPAIFKALFGTNETLFTLMMNYIIMNIISFCIIFFGWENSMGSGTIGIINLMTRRGWLPAILDNQYVLTILLVLIITVLMYIYLRFSKHGYEISVVGESEKTARYVGIGVGKVIIRTMLLSGAICGFVGFLMVGGVNHTVYTGLAGGMGFTAIMVSWLAKFNPFIMIGTSFMIVFLEKGADEIASQFRLNSAFADILTGIIIFFIIGCEFFINYRIHVRRSHKSVKEAENA